MPVTNGRAHVARTRRTNPCDGCGRILPCGSEAMLWSIWSDGFRRRVRLCSDCQEVVYGCSSRRPLDSGSDEHMVRDMCERCDGYPFCERVEYLRGSRPGDIHFGDLHVGG